MSNKGKKIKDNNKGTGNGRIEWKYFNKLDEILAVRPATHPPVLLETLKPIESDSDVTDVEGQDDIDSSAVELQGQSDVIEDDGSGMQVEAAVLLL